MPEEIEVPTEHLHEKMHEAAEEDGSGMIMKIALSSAFLAVFAAIAALMAGHSANQALMLQVQASDHWAEFQAKSIKAAVLESKLELLQALKKKPSDDDVKKLAEYKDDQAKLFSDANDLTAESAKENHSDIVLARAVTCFQIAIALSAIAVLSRKRALWYFGIVLSLFGIVFLVVGLL